MNKKFFAIAACAFMIALGCSSDDTNGLVEKPGTEVPENPDTEEPGVPETPKETLAFPAADFEDWNTFTATLSDPINAKHGSHAIGEGIDGSNALKISGTPTKNDNLFKVTNVKDVPSDATKLSFYVKGTAGKSLSIWLYNNDASAYYSYNLGDVSADKTIPTATQPDYVGTIDTKGEWAKMTLDLTQATNGYNTSGEGLLLVVRIGKDKAYDLVVDNFKFEDGKIDGSVPEVPTDPETPTEPEVPTDPETPTEPGIPGQPGDFNIPADQLAYYAGVDFTKTGMALKDELSTLTTKKHTKTLSYGNIWDASKATDVTPNGNEVYLIYGHKNVTTGKTAYTRDKNKNGGTSTDWNREHTYAKSLGTPNLGESGPGADAHHLRPADVTWNSTRGNLKFVKGAGLSGTATGGWYPGDEWKGDVARMMMYMYVRYDSRCLPTGVAVGTKNNIDPKMVDLLLEWNAQDPVSEIEKKRNTYHANTSNSFAQGNRNPFIDNPYLATQIWGGPTASNTWK